MDGQRFDELARLVATGVPRRRVLGMIAGGLAALGSRITSSSATIICLPQGDPCIDTVLECCPGSFCDSGGSGTCVSAQICVPENETCGIQDAGVPVTECCEGLECVGNTCVPIQQECRDPGESCNQIFGGETLRCCEGLVCIDGTCAEPEPVCSEEGVACGGKGDPECCEGLQCIEEICQPPPPTCIEEGGSCNGGAGVDGECCDGLTCIDGLCGVPAKCLPEGEACEGDLDCCTGICCGGACREIECCIDEPNPNDRCDDGQTCNEGICEGVTDICESDDDCDDDTCCCEDGGCSEDCCEEPVTQLPDTGVGQDVDRNSGWMAAAAGAAVAFLAGKKLRETPAEAEATE